MSRRLYFGLSCKISNIIRSVIRSVIQSGPVRSGPIQSDPVRSSPIQSDPDVVEPSNHVTNSKGIGQWLSLMIILSLSGNLIIP